MESIDVEGLLVAFLNEIVYLGEVLGREGVASVHVTHLDPTALDADFELAPVAVRGVVLLVKAATYHRLEVTDRPDGRADARVYLDV